MFDFFPPEIIEEIASNLDSNSLFCLSIVSSQFSGLLDNIHHLRQIIKEIGYYGNIKDVGVNRLKFLYKFMKHMHQPGDVYMMGDIDGILLEDEEQQEQEQEQEEQEEQDNIREMHLKDIIEISTSERCLCLTKAGEVYELQVKYPYSKKEPFEVKLIKGLTNIVQVSTLRSDSLFLTKDGQVYFRGYHTYGPQRIEEVLTGDPPTKKVKLVPNLENIVNITAGHNRSFCVRNDGQVYSFGKYFYNKPLNDKVICDVPTLIRGLENIIHVSDTQDLVLFLDVKGQIYAHGKVSSEKVYTEPTLIPNVNNIIQIASNEFYSLCLRDDHRLYIFGEYYFFDIETDNTFSGLENVIKISTAYYRCLFLTKDDKVYVAGMNYDYYPNGGDNSPFDLIPDIDNVLDIYSWLGCDLVIRKNISK